MHYYDFAWDDTADLGVWYADAEFPNGVNVEGHVLNRQLEATGEYTTAKDIPIASVASVVTHDRRRLSGAAARAYVEKLAGVQRNGRYLPNES